MNLEAIIQSIQPVDHALLKKAKERLDQLTKPQGSLGELEEIAKRLFAIYGNLDREIQSKAIFVLAGDHGITEEGISAYPQEVTGQMLANFVEGGAAISVLSRLMRSKLIVADFGIISEVVGREHSSLPTIFDCKIRRGTRNFLHENAMTREETMQAILAGYHLLENVHENEPLDLVALGEMGIGNTTSATAIIAALSGKPVSEITGKGTGVNDRVLKNKVSVLERTLQNRKPAAHDPLDVLSKVGGYEIAGLVGIYLGCARLGIPCIIDGVISASSAYLAYRLAPSSKDYFFASHLSSEPAHQVVLGELNLYPLIHGRLRLGEASGAALGFPLFEGAWKMFKEMATFESAGVSKNN